MNTEEPNYQKMKEDDDPIQPSDQNIVIKPTFADKFRSCIFYKIVVLLIANITVVIVTVYQLAILVFLAQNAFESYILGLIFFLGYGLLILLVNYSFGLALLSKVILLVTFVGSKLKPCFRNCCSSDSSNTMCYCFGYLIITFYQIIICIIAILGVIMYNMLLNQLSMLCIAIRLRRDIIVYHTIIKQQMVNQVLVIVFGIWMLCARENIQEGKSPDKDKKIDYTISAEMYLVINILIFVWLALVIVYEFFYMQYDEFITQQNFQEQITQTLQSENYQVYYLTSVERLKQPQVDNNIQKLLIEELKWKQKKGEPLYFQFSTFDAWKSTQNQFPDDDQKILIEMTVKLEFVRNTANDTVELRQKGVKFNPESMELVVRNLDFVEKDFQKVEVDVSDKIMLDPSFADFIAGQFGYLYNLEFRDQYVTETQQAAVTFTALKCIKVLENIEFNTKANIVLKINSNSTLEDQIKNE